jgi:hypothetical protein
MKRDIFMKKNSILLGLVLLLGCFVLYKTSPTTITPFIKATIAQQKTTIMTIDTPKNTASTKILYLDIISFPEDVILKHSKLGALGYASNFFIDFEATMNVSKKELYHFLIASDDGFRLFIDGKPICEFLGDRPLAKNECTVLLDKGEHLFFLSYFQGYGRLGLQAYYRPTSSNAYNFVGVSSPSLTFKKLKGEDAH